jgi:hypothetical protein
MKHMIYQNIRIRVRRESNSRQKKNKRENLTAHTVCSLELRAKLGIGILHVVHRVIKIANWHRRYNIARSAAFAGGVPSVARIVFNACSSYIGGIMYCAMMADPTWQNSAKKIIQSLANSLLLCRYCRKVRPATKPAHKASSTHTRAYQSISTAGSILDSPLWQRRLTPNPALEMKGFGGSTVEKDILEYVVVWTRIK